MTTALRHSSVAAAAILLLALAPVQAAGPLALFAKQIVKQMVKDFFESQLTSLVRESIGPCKSMLLDMARARAVPGMGALTGMGGVPGVATTPAMNAPMPPQIGQLMPSTPVMPGGEAMDPAMAAQMQQVLAAMQTAQPLSPVEVDELVDRLVVLSKAVPDVELPCSPADLKLVFNMSASMPMASGPLRMMLTQFREMDVRFKEVADTFAKMSSAEQGEAVDLLVAEAASLSADERKQAAGFLQSDLFGLPPAVREQLRVRIAALP
jgi:hypothetical protein